jgi:hypothetical protein
MGSRQSRSQQAVPTDEPFSRLRATNIVAPFLPKDTILWQLPVAAFIANFEAWRIRATATDYAHSLCDLSLVLSERQEGTCKKEGEEEEEGTSLQEA